MSRNEARCLQRREPWHFSRRRACAHCGAMNGAAALPERRAVPGCEVSQRPAARARGVSPAARRPPARERDTSLPGSEVRLAPSQKHRSNPAARRPAFKTGNRRAGRPCVFSCSHSYSRSHSEQPYAPEVVEVENTRSPRKEIRSRPVQQRLCRVEVDDIRFADLSAQGEHMPGKRGEPHHQIG